MQTVPQHLSDTARAFDSVAADYDGVSGNNALVQLMRAELWREVKERVPIGARLLDLGCGTGIDTEYFAQRGYFVTATDASPEMVSRTRQRIAHANLAERVEIENIGAQDLERLARNSFDAIYSDLGPLNCVPDLSIVAKQCHAHLKPKGLLIFSGIGRYCPWEMLFFSLHGDFKQATRRFSREMVPVNLNDGIVWTRYYSPREFFQFFENEFRLVTYRSLALFMLPPYLLRWYERGRALMKPLGWLDSQLGALPLLRDAGDHFLIVMQTK
ncbi:MAG TPA: class I SAM-dependent methyltransferase [Anaerolineae bacterium]|nr:class I SAM-dependent methyltransferase [Anaerolineae bacterium]